CVPNAPGYKTCVVAAQCLPLLDTPKYNDCIITEAKCNSLLGKPAYDSCITTVKSGVDIIKSQIEFMIFKIDQDLGYQNQLLKAKQNTLGILNQSIDILKQLKDCQKSEPPELAQVQSAKSAIESQITQIQSVIIARKTLKDDINKITDLSQIAAFQARVTREVNPGATQKLAFDAEEETKKKEEKRNAYQADLTLCLAGNP
ncbi:MAG: hypothetical protein ABIJ19_00760, partial [Patescibacteria group bacterium]